MPRRPGGGRPREVEDAVPCTFTVPRSGDQRARELALKQGAPLSRFARGVLADFLATGEPIPEVWEAYLWTVIEPRAVMRVFFPRADLAKLDAMAADGGLSRSEAFSRVLIRALNRQRG